MDRSDRDHAACARLLSNAEEMLLVPAPVVVELDWLVSARLQPAAFVRFLADVEEGNVRIVDLTAEDYTRVRELCAKYADLPLGFVDAAVLAVAERYQESRVATLDHRHFNIVRLRHAESLRLLPDTL
jgi:predicted nucleic acid-binding protein